MYFNKVYGVRTSGLLFLFWLLMFLCGIPRVRTETFAREDVVEEENKIFYQFVSFIIFFSLTCVMLLLNCFADVEPRVSKFEKQEKPCPEMSSSFLSRIFFAWFDRMAITGFRKPLETKDLWDMRYEDSSSVVSPSFIKQWNKAVAKVDTNLTINSQATYSKEKESTERIEFSTSKQKKQASIVLPLIKAFGGTFLVCYVIHLLY